ncbi:MAG: N-methyl-L-tryptophan oxidase [Thermomicrobiales bacterium]|nr:MAG: N-methyl-L-tryptophan oxidase [Thermomicrobiales bacterium]
MPERTWDVIVLGGGTMGTAAAWALSTRGASVLVLEQFTHIHTMGSHGGGTRIFRHAYAEGPEYVPLMFHADNLWCALETELGTSIVHRVGILEMDAPGYDHAKRARDSAQENGVDFEWLDADEIRKRWPAFDPPEGWEGGWSPIAGFLDVEAGLSGLAAVARRGDVTFRTEEPVLGWSSGADGVQVATTQGSYSGGKLVVTAGSWASDQLSELGLPLEVVRKNNFWIDVDQPELFQPGVFPVFATASDIGEVYGFPIFRRPGIKMAEHRGGETTTPQTVDRVARDEEADSCVDLAAVAMKGVTRRVLNGVICMYTRTPDDHFIVDRHPTAPNVVLAAGFSGHGFKFTPAIGELLADLALEADTEPFPLFRIDRFTGVPV